MRKFIYAFIVLGSILVKAQNKQILYDFAEIPQTLLLNPALENNYKYHIGFPALSGISTSVGSSDINLSDLFAVDNRNINDKINEVLNRISTRDFLRINQQIDVINGGFRFKDKHYISFGFYQEVDAISYLPKDALLLATEGNNINQRYNINQINYKADYLGVLHVGISKQMNDQLTLGGRFKIYSSALNVQSTNNTGTFVTVPGSNNIYTHVFSDVNFVNRTSGLVDETTDEYISDASSYISNTFLGGNLGLGIDIGFNYKIDEQLQFSASLIDFGFINHSKNVKNSRVEGDFIFEGVEFEYDPNSSLDYWEQIDTRFQEELPRTDDQESYTTWRPLQFYSAIKYSFGKQRSKVCYNYNYKDFYTNAIGAQLHTIFRPVSPQLALTAFYQYSFSDKLHTKFTYTVDDFSYANLGFGLSAQVWKFNFYGMVDNLLSMPNLASANAVSLQLGINLIFN